MITLEKLCVVDSSRFMKGQLDQSEKVSVLTDTSSRQSLNNFLWEVVDSYSKLSILLIPENPTIEIP